MSDARRIAAVTVSRADYGLMTPVYREIVRRADLDLLLMVGGTHLEPRFGMTVRAINDDGFEIGDRIQMDIAGDKPCDVADIIGRAVSGFAKSFARLRPDIVLLLGDRFEMHAAAVAALPFNLPIAHVHGGDLSLGAMDDALRHSMTKLSHLHFAATKLSAQRIHQMGEEDWRITISGAPGVDALAAVVRLDPQDLMARLGLEWTSTSAPLLVTFHPETKQPGKADAQVQALIDALSRHLSARPVIVTAPNADPENQLIRERLTRFVANHPSRARLVETLGTQVYVSLMAHAAAMVGNSSSGLIEAPSLGLPVVNLGGRQDGRERAKNVIDVPVVTVDAVDQAIRDAINPAFRDAARKCENPYGDGRAAPRIAARLSEVDLGPRLLRKTFAEWPMCRRDA